MKAGRKRTATLEEFVEAFDEFVLTGATYGRFRSEETLNRFNNSRERLTRLREQLGDPIPTRTAAVALGVAGAD